MKTWIKGGVVGLIVGVIFYFMILFGVADIFIGTITQKILFYIFSPLCMILENTSFVGGPAYTGVCIAIFGLPFNILVYGILGVIVSWLIGKIKSKKQ